MEDVASILARELPLDEGPLTIDLAVPRAGLGLQRGQIRDPALAQTLAGEESDFEFGLIEPAPVLGRVVNGEAAPEERAEFCAQVAGQRFAAVNIEIVDHQVDDSHRERPYRDRRSNGECSVFERGRKPGSESASDQSERVLYGALQQNPNFIPLLACYDLSRTAPLPASDGCPNSTSGLYTFNGHADIREEPLYLQDTINVHNWTFNLGIRGDFYHGITTAIQGEPRLGIAYRVKPTSTVIRASYARTMETPFNENLVLASSGCLDPVINALQTPVPGGACVSQTPLSPGHRNEFHVGLSQAFGRYFVVDAEYIWKYTHKAFDFSVLGDTPITYPIEWQSSKIPGYAIRGSMPNFHGLTAFVVMSSVAARFFGPQISGIGAAPGGISVFRIDHDEKFQPDHSPAVSAEEDFALDQLQLAFRQRSGGRSCAVRGGQLRQRPERDRQHRGRLRHHAGSAVPGGTLLRERTTRPRPLPSVRTELCPASMYGSKYLSLPAPGTENDDHNPPRIASRNLFDLGVGHDNILHGDRYKVSARLTIVNLTNKEALYNFISTFSGTHYVTPGQSRARSGSTSSPPAA